ncbi:Mitogen-activated protein kinase kinase 9, partial [Linum perenne]
NFIFSELTERRPRFPLPLRPSSVAVTPTTATSCSSLITFDLEKLCVLGYSNGGTVYKVHNRRTSQIYALKLVRGDNDPLIRRQILRHTDSPVLNLGSYKYTKQRNASLLVWEGA